MLIMPTGDGAHPAVVVADGTAGGQRDFCRLSAQAPLDAGVAVLIYDKQGHGRSAGKADPAIFDQANALSAALDALASTPGIDSGRVGLLGFSNGMWAVRMAAARRPDVAFVAGVGSPGVTLAESEVHRRTKVLRDAGVGAETLAARRYSARPGWHTQPGQVGRRSGGHRLSAAGQTMGNTRLLRSSAGACLGA
jgi:pimeloyl-ACP methyl ester carboxylesterase